MKSGTETERSIDRVLIFGSEMREKSIILFQVSLTIISINQKL